MKSPFPKLIGARLQSPAAILPLIVALLLLDGCYYIQAMRGQLDVMNRRRPVDEVIQDGDVSGELKQRLEIVRDARRFAVDDLLLPDNDSYLTYADLEREFVVWNVFAAPEFSLEPKRWCYPVAGCVAYRGYFKEDAARKHAEKLGQQGYDVAVGGVSAYSTLGRFADPVLNTMMRWNDVDLVATLFHELAHQRLYVKGDTEFNESFATAVAEIGIGRWLAARGEIDSLEARRQRTELRRGVMALISNTKGELRALYESDAAVDDMRRDKVRILDRLAVEIETEIDAAGADNWLPGPLNNARLASQGLYEGRLEEFRDLLSQCDDDLACFYARAERLVEGDQR